MFLKSSGIPEIYRDRFSYDYEFYLNSTALGLEWRALDLYNFQIRINFNLTGSYVFYWVYEYFYPSMKILKIRDEFYFGTSPGIMAGYYFKNDRFGVFFEYSIQYLIENNQFTQYGTICKIIFVFLE